MFDTCKGFQNPIRGEQRVVIYSVPRLVGKSCDLDFFFRRLRAS